jgi:LAS superfamily LD-carboxypeptidase LdcB
MKKNIPKDYLLGKFDIAKDTDFVIIPREYCLYHIKYIPLHREVLAHFIKMYQAAEKDGVSLKVVSAQRNFEQQKQLWDNKFNSNEITEEQVKKALWYVAMPCTSRHHWGTDLDIGGVDENWFNSTTEGRQTYIWLKENAHKFNFFQPYTFDRIVGYCEEKWHWSYKPLAVEFQNAFKNKITYEDISEFKGCEYAQNLNIIENYVFGINRDFLI